MQKKYLYERHCWLEVSTQEFWYLLSLVVLWLLPIESLGILFLLSYRHHINMYKQKQDKYEKYAWQRRLFFIFSLLANYINNLFYNFFKLISFFFRMFKMKIIKSEKDLQSSCCVSSDGKTKMMDLYLNNQDEPSCHLNTIIRFLLVPCWSIILENTESRKVSEDIRNGNTGTSNTILFIY